MPENTVRAQQQEIDALRQFANRWDHNSYLHGLFRAELVAWAAEQIRDDVCPDIWDAYHECLRDHERLKQWGNSWVEQANEQSTLLASAEAEIVRLKARLWELAEMAGKV